MTIATTLLALTLAAAFVTGCTTHRVTRIDERIVLVPASAVPAAPAGSVARGIQGTVIEIDRVDDEVTLLLPDGRNLIVKLPSITTGLLREGDLVAVDPPVTPDPSASPRR